MPGAVWHDLNIDDEVLAMLYARNIVEPVVTWRFTEEGESWLEEAIDNFQDRIEAEKQYKKYMDARYGGEEE